MREVLGIAEDAPLDAEQMAEATGRLAQWVTGQVPTGVSDGLEEDPFADE